MKAAIALPKAPRTPKPWIIVVLSSALMAVPLVVLKRSGDAAFGAITFLLTGRAFLPRPIITGGALDQPSLQKELFILCYSVGVVFPFLALVRWINRASPPLIRLVFAAFSLVLLVHPLSILTIFTYDVARYILVMGMTPKRLLGLAVAAIGYFAILPFAIWIWSQWESRDT